MYAKNNDKLHVQTSVKDENKMIEIRRQQIIRCRGEAL